MTEYVERIYREGVSGRELTSFCIRAEETDLWISAKSDLQKEALDLVLDLRNRLKTYIKAHPLFLTTLSPYPADPTACGIIRDMISASREAGVGPMACVAGAIAQYLGTALLDITDQIIVENGGDIFMKMKNSATVSIFAGNSPLSGKIGINIPAEKMPLGVCSSSGKIGHSLSMGNADSVTVVSPSAIIADGAATAIGNCMKTAGDLETIEEKSSAIKGVTGCIVIMEGMMSAWGDIELVEL